MRKFHRTLGWALAMTWGQRALGTLATFVLAGMLGPTEFGTVAIAVVYLGFLQLFLEQGLAAAIVQRRALESEHLDAAFWMNVGWSVGLTAASVLLGRWWAHLNDLPRLTPIIAVLSLGFLLQGLTVVHEAVLERAMRFRRLAIFSNAAAIGGAATGVGLALGGAGVWALVGQQLVNALTWLVLVWTGSGWQPRLRFSAAHARRLLGFSLQVFAGNLGVYVSSRLDVLLIGLFTGAAGAGLYRVASRLVDTVLELTTRPVRLITLPHLARLQGTPDLRHGAETALHASCLLAVPSLVVLAACSRQVVAVLGSSWDAAGDALALLCMAGIGKAVLTFAGPTLQALDKPHLRTLAVWALVAVSAPVLCLSAAALHAAPVGAQVVGMATVSTVVFVLLFVPASMLLVTHAAGLRVVPLLPRIAPSFAAGGAALAATASLTASAALDGVAPLPALGVMGGVAILSAGIVLVLLEPAIATPVRALARAALGQKRHLAPEPSPLDDPRPPA
jgi:PST family polysaccharide transporter